MEFLHKYGGALIVAASFVLVSAALILGGDGVPYVMDNNETFSSLNHAYNLWHFDFFSSFGLADEAVSPAAAAHPVVHSHQGNFPRLFAYLIYAVGARSAESQIWLTTIAIGTPTVLIGYWFFRRLSGELFAVIAMLLLITDYLLFAQWQINTYRVWHGFFFFSAFASVYGHELWPRRTWVALTIPLYAGLFYWELVFATFTAVSVGLFVLWTHRNDVRSIFRIGAMQGLGAFLGLAVVVIQLMMYLGWYGFVQDLTLTLTARNFAPSDPAFLERLRSFYETENIAFFYNIQSAQSFAGLLPFARSLFANVFQVSTPLISLLLFVGAASALLADSRLPNCEDTKALRRGDRGASLGAMSMGGFVLMLGLWDDGGAVLGRAWSGFNGGFLGALIASAATLIAAIAFAFLLDRLARNLSLSGAPPTLRRALRVGLLFWLTGVILIGQGLLYSSFVTDRLDGVLIPIGAPIARILVFLAAASGAVLILGGKRTILGRWQGVPASLVPFLICGGIAYGVVFALSAGYLHSGYLYRQCPLPIFCVLPLMALGLFTPIAATYTLLSRTGFNNIGSVRLSTACAGLVATAIVVLWTFVQVRYVQLLPPNQAALLKALQRVAVPGGIASNAYGVPLGLVSGTWAYMLPGAQNVEAIYNEKATAANPYVWFADRRHNSAYSKPATYVCWIQVSGLTSLASTIRDESSKCSKLDIVARGLYVPAVEAKSSSEVIARDPADRWAIVRLKP